MYGISVRFISMQKYALQNVWFHFHAKVCVTECMKHEGAGIAQSVRAGRTAFDSRQETDFFKIFYSLQTGSGAHPAYPVGSAGPFRGGKVAGV
jgi:hypothetical protein